MKEKMALINTADWKQSLLFLVSATVIPSIFNYYYYCGNSVYGITFYHSTVFSLICAAGNILLFLFLSKFMSKPAGLLCTLLLWISFWVVVPISTALSLYINRVQTAICVIIVVVVITLCLRLVRFSVFVGNIIASMICLLFVFNFAQSCVIALGNVRALSTNQDSLIKSNFTVDTNLSKPDIIWIHADGMLSFSTVEKFFGDKQNDLRAHLDNNGFLINEDARLSAGNTSWGVPCLLSPYLHDTYLGDIFKGVDNIGNTETRFTLVNKKFNEDGFFFRSVWNREEIFVAFMQAGYRANGGFLPSYGYHPIDLYYSKSSTGNVYLMQKEHIATDAEFEKKLNYCTYIESLANFTALQIIRGFVRPYVDNARASLNSIIYEVPRTTSYESCAEMVMLKDLLNLPSPQISYIFMNEVHYPFIRDENGDLLSPAPKDDIALTNYLPQHKYGSKILMDMIDLIIRQNSEAIIIVQADHGIASHKNGKYLKEGYSEEQIFELLTSTLSAVRIPPQYGVLTEPLDPLDISRWLVNHFVGEGNYNYLYYEENE